MIKTGHIEITDKVRFVFHELKMPDKKTYDKAKLYNFENLIIQKYEASKRVIEVSNEYKIGYVHPDSICIWIKEKPNKIKRKEYARNNQPCKAEVNGTAEVIELL